MSLEKVLSTIIRYQTQFGLGDPTGFVPVLGQTPSSGREFFLCNFKVPGFGENIVSMVQEVSVFLYSAIFHIDFFLFSPGFFMGGSWGSIISA